MLQKLIDDLKAVEDPAERLRLTTEALEHIREIFNVQVSELRQEAVQELKDQGLTLEAIGKLAKPHKPLHPTRIQQILKGAPTGRWAKAARNADAPKDTETT